MTNPLCLNSLNGFLNYGEEQTTFDYNVTLSLMKFSYKMSI